MSSPSPRWIGAQAAAEQLSITLQSFYSHLRHGNIVGGQPASKVFAREHEHTRGPAPAWMFDRTRLVLIERTPGRPRKHDADDDKLTMLRSTPAEAELWAEAATLESARTGVPMTVGPWARRVLNDAARAVKTRE